MPVNILNEKEYPRFNIVPKHEYQSSCRKTIKKTSLKMISHDSKYKIRKRAKNTFLIDNPAFLQNDGKRSIGGIFSPKYGQDTMDPDSRTYSCECGHLTTAINENKLCPACNTLVQYITPDLRTIAYIDIAPYHILTYHGYNYMKKAVKGNINDIIAQKTIIDKRGHATHDGETLLSLYENYEELYEHKTGLPKNVVFTSKIPVYSAILRPLVRKGSKMSMLEVNKYYQSINILSMDLKNISHIKAVAQINKNLGKIQEEFLAICKHLTDQIKGKGGIFRKYGVSGRVDNSSRMVITLNTDLEAHEIDIPYQTAMIIYEEQIINSLMILQNTDLAHAVAQYQLALNYRDETMVKIINTHISKGLWAMINRNPTISKHGILYMKVRKIHDKFDDYSMAIGPDILKLLAADFDGDQLSFFAVKDGRFHELFKRTFCPTYAYINRATGYFNKSMSLTKDYLAITSKLWSMFGVIDDTIMNPSEHAYNRFMSCFDISEDDDEPVDVESYENIMGSFDILWGDENLNPRAKTLNNSDDPYVYKNDIGLIRNM